MTINGPPFDLTNGAKSAILTGTSNVSAYFLYRFSQNICFVDWNGSTYAFRSKIVFTRVVVDIMFFEDMRSLGDENCCLNRKVDALLEFVYTVLLRTSLIYMPRKPV